MKLEETTSNHNQIYKDHTFITFNKSYPNPQGSDV